MSTLSLIVTAYRVRPWIEAALASAAEVLRPGDELIVVDDGSDDGGPARIRAFEADGRCPEGVAFRPVLLGTNTPGGVGAAANIGMSLAEGEIVAFLDGDDELLPEGFAASRAAFEAAPGADILIANYEDWIAAEDRTEPPFDAGLWAGAPDPGGVGPRTLALSMTAVPWRKLYRRDFLEERGLRFPERIFHEEDPFHWAVCLAAREIRFLDRPVCRHRIDRSGKGTGQGDEILAVFAHYERIRAMLPRREREFEALALRWLVRHMSRQVECLRAATVPAWVAAAHQALGRCPRAAWSRLGGEDLPDPALAALFEAIRKGRLDAAERGLLARVTDRVETELAGALARAEAENEALRGEIESLKASLRSDPLPELERRFLALAGPRKPDDAAPAPTPAPPEGADPAPPLYWLGLHKTGTTFLQACLEASAEGLARHGIDYIPRERFREAHIRPVFETPGPAPAPSPVGRPGAGRRVIFDENILGFSQDIARPEGLYPEGAWRAEEIAERLELHAPHLVLGLRGFAGYLPSLYCEALKVVPFLHFRDFLRTPFERISWLPLIEGLLRSFPEAPLTLYTAESLRGHEAALVAHLTGLPADEFHRVDHSERPGFSQAAIDAMVAAHERGELTPGRRGRLVREHPRGPDFPGFDPWSEDERRALDARYAAELAELATWDRVTLIDPGAL